MAKSIRLIKRKKMTLKKRKAINRKSKNQHKRLSRRKISKFYGGEVGKNILLIIDPQNDFSDIDGTNRKVNGSLVVNGSSEDYKKIIAFIETNKDKLHEIHVSLDTHTLRHIGHPAFWSRKNDDGSVVNAEDDKNDGLRVLSIDEFNKITGTHPWQGSDTVEYIPRKYDGDTVEDYQKLCDYVYKYLNFFKDERNKHGQSAWIWNNHCIEGTFGHEIAKELQEKLTEFSKISDKIVRYHIKGQNNLAEMYSIFSAESPVIDDDATELNKYVYTGDKNTNLPKEGADSYESAMKSLNLNTSPNTIFVKYLLENKNKVYICGEAKTHCVKSSLIDLNELVDEAKRENIYLLANMTSPIIGLPDDIVEVSTKYGNKVIEADTYEIV